MGFLRWLVEEARSLLSITLYFLACFAIIMLLKRLWLAEYGIEFRGASIAVLAAVVTAKVVIVMEKMPLQRWMRSERAVTEVAARTALYSFVTLIVLIIEKAVDSRAEYGGVVAAIAHVFEHREIHQVWAATLGLALSFAAYNAFGVIRREIGAKQLVRMFFSIPGKATETSGS